MRPQEDDAQERLLKLELRLAQLQLREKAQEDFLTFVKHVWPEFIAGEHHRIIAEKLQRVASGDLKRLIINMAPRHTKSEFASFLFPAWFMGKFPNKKIIQATHTTELAVGFGRKTKNLIERDDYRDLFDVKLAADSKASGRWDTDRGGMYYAVGVGSNLAGRGGDLIIIDDPHSEQTLMSNTGFDDAWDWYTGGPRQRLQPGGAIVVVMCMTGDTSVLLADGSQRPLRDIRPGEAVATYDGGSVSVSKVVNWQSSGVDSVFTARTRSGRMVRANGRHPFLVDVDGDRQWIQMQHLRPGLSFVALKGVRGPRDLKQSPTFAKRVRRARHTIEKTLTRLIGRWEATESGRGWFAPRTVAAGMPFAVDFATTATERTSCRPDRRKRTVPPGLSPVTGSLSSSMIRWLSSAATGVMSAGCRLARRTPGLTGLGNFVSTIVTTRGRFGGSFATIAILPLDTENARTSWSGQPPTYEIEVDPIVEILPDGEEEVFDVEIERTGNFIANGVVSHNTRWHEKDLTGQLIRAQARDPMADQWEVVELPAIMPSGNSCWPEYWSLEDLERVRASIPPGKWNAQYQQNPTGDENSILRRDWWRIWEREKVPPLEYVIQSYDTAFSKRETADYSAITTWGVFRVDEGGPPALMLLDAKKGRWDFPELKREAWELYRFWEPETVIIEAKATGMPLTHELRNMGIPVVNFTPSRGNDKISRAHSIAPLFEAGMIWAPDEQWAHELIEECAAFPNGEYDDYVDSTTQALMRYRQGNFVQLPTDDWPDEDEVSPRIRAYYG